MAADLRVPLGPILEAFGVPATVMRPAPDDTPIETTGIWISPLTAEMPSGLEFRTTELRMTERRYLLALPRADVPTIPRGTRIAAPEVLGQVDQWWRVDGVEQADSDHHRVLLVPDPDGSS
jgi:hypothetical protein